MVIITSKSKFKSIKKKKLMKQGLIKKSKKVLPKGRNVNATLPTNKRVHEASENEESDYGEDILRMVEDEDMDYLKSSLENRSYKIYNKIKYFGTSRSKELKENNKEDVLEENYERENVTEIKDKIKVLLPIKTKTGIIPQEIIEDKEEDKDNGVDNNVDNIYEIDLDHTSRVDVSKPISAAQLLLTRNEVLRDKRIQIGHLCSSLLENPEEKITNLRILLSIIDENLEAHFTIKKIVIISLLEIFKDILPSYEIKKINNEGMKLKKDTLKLQKYEESLLLYYKKYLMKLEKCVSVLVKKCQFREFKASAINLAMVAVQALCDLLVTHLYFNYSENIAQLVVPLLNSQNSNIREMVKLCIKQVFREDKKEEITMKILRIINQYLKNKQNFHTDIIDILLVLNIKNVNLDQGKEQGLKEKMLMAHKSRVLQLSKKERKRKKRLIELEKELLETKAEENKQAKEKNIAEITKILFNIYFRILKTCKNNKILGVCLQGLAKFAHCINWEYYLDIVNVLDKLLKEDWLTFVERLHCIQTVFAILSGQGEAINLDPVRFYNSLYNDLLDISVCSKKLMSMEDLLQTLNDALLKRRKKVTNNRIIGFVKRLTTLSLQLSHDGCLGCLALIRNILQLNKSVNVLLDFDPTFGEGRFQAELCDPEYSNASSTALYELLILNKHYHPIVKMLAKNIAYEVPAVGEASLSGIYGKTTLEQFYKEFDMSRMRFNPPVPSPKQVKFKSKIKQHQFIDKSFRETCKNSLKNIQDENPFWINRKHINEI